jgi:hypothetical protein
VQLDCHPIPIDLIMHNQVKYKDIFKIKDKEHWLMHRGLQRGREVLPCDSKEFDAASGLNQRN